MLVQRPGNVGVRPPYLIAQKLTLLAVNRSPRLNQIALGVELHDRWRRKAALPQALEAVPLGQVQGRSGTLRDPDMILRVGGHRTDVAGNPVVRQRLRPGGVVLERRDPVPEGRDGVGCFRGRWRRLTAPNRDGQGETHSDPKGRQRLRHLLLLRSGVRRCSSRRTSRRHPSTRTTTRRFLARPSRSSLGATG